MAFNKAKALVEAQKYVSQGKIQQAIKQYLLIIEKDPTDLTQLNTVGDLYVRDKNVAVGLNYFHKLADAYVNDGFIVQAIAIYKKITKIDPNSIDPLLKLGDLYRTQHLLREAREQYTSALESYKKSNKKDKALEALHRLAELEPDSIRARLNLAEFARSCGQKRMAGEAFIEAATLAEKQGDAATVDDALNKAAEFFPDHPKVEIHRAQQALEQQQPEKAERILLSFPELQRDATARRLLLRSYVAVHKLAAAQKLLGEVFHGNPEDFMPVAGFVDQCLAQGNPDAAFEAVCSVAPVLVERRNTGPLMESLRKISAAAPQRIPVLDLMYEVAEKTADESTIPETLEALGRACTETGHFEKAEQAYVKLVAREPQNETYRGLLKQVLEIQGKEYQAPELLSFSGADVALEAESEPGDAVASSGPPSDHEQETVVKEAIDNSDLLVRYNLTENAVAELDKVLKLYPEQIDVHKRILEACRKNLPARAAKAAEALAGIFAARGDSASTNRYKEMARELAESAAGTETSTTEVKSTVAQGPPATEEIDLTQMLAHSSELATEEPLPAPQEIPLEFGSATGAASLDGSKQERSGEAQSAEAVAPSESQQGGAELPPFNEESREEIEFYLAQGFYEEAERAIRVLEKNYPGNSQVSDLRRRVDGARSEPGPSGKVQADGGIGDNGNELIVELPTSFPESGSHGSETPQAAQIDSGATDHNAMEDLAGNLASSLGDAPAAEPSPAASNPSAGNHPSESSSSSGDLVEGLAGLLDELNDGEQLPEAEDDQQTHYNLGVAFREMGLLDEAIGEFQKVAKGAAKDNFPPNFLQACTLLAGCFTDKEMPAIAAKWYLRALDTPGLDDEAVLALQYELGVAYERAGNSKSALEKFSEVYSQNIDYRDVAEKIRILQQQLS